jgi:hypothetical protein
MPQICVAEALYATEVLQQKCCSVYYLLYFQGVDVVIGGGWHGK